MIECPYGEAILHYAKERGLKNARLHYEDGAGWELCGDGGYENWPLVWAIGEELGIARGCGGSDYQQIDPQNF